MGSVLIALVGVSISPGQDIYEPDDTPEQATPISVGAVLSGLSVSPEGDVDWFVFESDHVGAFTLETSANGADTLLTVFSGDGSEVVGINDDLEHGTHSSLTLILPPGLFYGKVESYRDDTIIADYGISIGADQPDSHEPDDRWFEGTLLDSYSVEHSLIPAGDTDWFEIQVNGSASEIYDICVMTNGPGPAGTELALYSTGPFGPDLESPLASDDNGGPGEFSLLRAHVEPGVYHVSVASDDSVTPVSQYSIHTNWALSGTIIDRPLQEIGLGRLTSVDFSSSGTRLFSIGGDSVYLWDPTTDQVIRSFRGFGPRLSDAALSHDESLLVTVDEIGTLTTWDALTGSRRSRTLSPLGASSVRFTPGDRWFVTTGDAGILLWNSEELQIERSLIAPTTGYRGRTDASSSVAVSDSTGEISIGDGKGGIWVYDIATANLKHFFRTGFDSNGQDGLSYSSDGQLLALTGQSAGIQVEQRTLVLGATDGIQVASTEIDGIDLDFSPTGDRIAIAEFGGSVSVWTWATGDVLVFDRDPAFSGFNQVDFHPDTDAIASGGDSSIAIRVWDSETGEIESLLTGHSLPVSGIALVSDEESAVVATAYAFAGDLRRWDLATGDEIQRWSGSSRAMTDVYLSEDGRTLLGGSSDGFVRLWRFTESEPFRSFGPVVLNNSVRGTFGKFISDESVIAYTGAGGEMHYWDLESQSDLGTYPGLENSYIRSFDVSANSRWAALGSTGYDLGIYDISTQSLVSEMTVSGFPIIGSVAFSPGSDWVCWGIDNLSSGPDLILWNVASAEVSRTWNFGAEGGIGDVRWREDGQELLLGMVGEPPRFGGRIERWTTDDFERTAAFNDGSSGVTSVNYMRGRDAIVSGNEDGNVAVWELHPPRAIVLAGGGDYPGNPIGPQTDALGAYAYRTLRARHYDPADILYLSAFGPADPASPEARPFRDADGDGLNDVDLWLTTENLEEALAGEFAQGAGRLLILAVDHGYATESVATFSLNPEEVVLSTTLNGWLDDLQSNYPVDVTLVMDFCYSGRFVEDLAGAPEGRQRIVVSSTTATAEAVFVPPPDLTSFMSIFLGSAYMGNSIGEAFRAGQRFFESFPVAGQMPQIDDGSGGTANADREFFGATWAYGVRSTDDINRFFPAFDSWSPDQTVPPGESVTLWTRLLPNQRPLEVTAVLRPPAPSVISGDPITNLPRVSLAQSVTDEAIWQATVSAEVVAEAGAYVISFTARFDFDRISNPVFSRVTVSEGIDPDTTPIRAILAIGDTADPDLRDSFGGLGPYAFRVYLDRFQDDEGISHPEWIEYLTPFLVPDRDAQPSSAAVLQAIEDIPPDVGRLFIHLVGDACGEGSVQMADGDFLTAEVLDAALDALQAEQDCTVVLLVDASGSGAFVPLCSVTGDQQRVVLTGSAEDETALFLPIPTLTSFSQRFLSAAYQGANLLEAHFAAGDFLRAFMSGTEPQLDDNGDGMSDFLDGDLAQMLYLGRRYAFAGDAASALPFVLGVEVESPVARGASVSVSAHLVEGVDPARVFAQLSSPRIAGCEPIANLPEHDLMRDGPESWVWSGTLQGPEEPGEYAVTVYATYQDGSSDRVSEPRVGDLTVMISNQGLLVR